MVHDIFKPRALRDLPEDPADAFIEVLNRLGPCTCFEMGKALRSKYRQAHWPDLVAQGRVVILRERPILFGLPDDKLHIDKEFNL